MNIYVLRYLARRRIKMITVCVHALRGVVLIDKVFDHLFFGHIVLLCQYI